MGGLESPDFPVGIAGLERALRALREYTLAIYAGLPDRFLTPSTFPQLPIVNPPLWELAHIAWFAEFFCLRWRPNDVDGVQTPCMLAGGDELFNSARVPHASRWANEYPSRADCFDYMERSLAAVLAALEVSSHEQRYFFQLALAHEAMHAEALAMTLNTIGLPMPGCLPQRMRLSGQCQPLPIPGGILRMGASDRVFHFDNEMPVMQVNVPPYEIDSRVVSETEFSAFASSAAYRQDEVWSEAGRVWRQSAPEWVGERDDFAAMHVSFYEAEAWCRWAGRRLPDEAEWEFAATHSNAFAGSAGHVWEWTTSPFNGYPGFVAGPYRDYSAPWFGSHMVLRGGSFATLPWLRYPQYRNFYMPHRRDVFCGFRSCALA